jgi:hypothetical protein
VDESDGRSNSIGMLKPRRAQTYREEAKRFLKMAKAAETAAARRELEDLAIRYEELAEHVELLERFRERGA